MALVAAGCLGPTDDAHVVPAAPLDRADIEELLTQPEFLDIQRSEHVVEGAGGSRLLRPLAEPGTPFEHERLREGL